MADEDGKKATPNPIVTKLAIEASAKATEVAAHAAHNAGLISEGAAAAVHTTAGVVSTVAAFTLLKGDTHHQPAASPKTQHPSHPEPKTAEDVERLARDPTFNPALQPHTPVVTISAAPDTESKTAAADKKSAAALAAVGAFSNSLLAPQPAATSDASSASGTPDVTTSATSGKKSTTTPAATAAGAGTFSQPRPRPTNVGPRTHVGRTADGGVQATADNGNGFGAAAAIAGGALSVGLTFTLPFGCCIS